MTASRSVPVALTIAGSDSSAGAGAQADLKTFSALGVYGLTALTCAVAEVPGKVTAIRALDAAFVAEQIALSFEAFPVAAVKTGMLYASGIIEVVCEFVEKNRPLLVVDPVMVATSGDTLLQKDAITSYHRLFNSALVVTPNLDEAGALLERRVTTLEEMKNAGHELREKFGGAWLLKGGHLAGEIATDLLFIDGETVEFSAPFVRCVSTHGTGCTYSAAIAAMLARGSDLRAAVAEAKRFVTGAIERHFQWNQTQALRHFPDPR